MSSSSKISTPCIIRIFNQSLLINAILNDFKMRLDIYNNPGPGKTCEQTHLRTTLRAHQSFCALFKNYMTPGQLQLFTLADAEMESITRDYPPVFYPHQNTTPDDPDVYHILIQDYDGTTMDDNLVQLKMDMDIHIYDDHSLGSSETLHIRLDPKTISYSHHQSMKCVVDRLRLFHRCQIAKRIIELSLQGKIVLPVPINEVKSWLKQPVNNYKNKVIDIITHHICYVPLYMECLYHHSPTKAMDFFKLWPYETVVVVDDIAVRLQVYQHIVKHYENNIRGLIVSVINRRCKNPQWQCVDDPYFKILQPLYTSILYHDWSLIPYYLNTNFICWLIQMKRQHHHQQIEDKKQKTNTNLLKSNTMLEYTQEIELYQAKFHRLMQLFILRLIIKTVQSSHYGREYLYHLVSSLFHHVDLDINHTDAVRQWVKKYQDPQNDDIIYINRYLASLVKLTHDINDIDDLEKPTSRIKRPAEQDPETMLTCSKKPFTYPEEIMSEFDGSYDAQKTLLLDPRLLPTDHGIIFINTFEYSNCPVRSVYKNFKKLVELHEKQRKLPYTREPCKTLNYTDHLTYKTVQSYLAEYKFILVQVNNHMPKHFIQPFFQHADVYFCIPQWRLKCLTRVGFYATSNEDEWYPTSQVTTSAQWICTTLSNLAIHYGITISTEDAQCKIHRQWENLKRYYSSLIQYTRGCGSHVQNELDETYQQMQYFASYHRELLPHSPIATYQSMMDRMVQ